MTNLLPTYKQLERTLAQKIRALYCEFIKFPPQKITCKFFSRYLAIIGDETLTPLEKSLIENGQQELTKQLRSEINHILQPKIVQLIEDIISVKIEEIFCNVTFTTNKSGILVILSEPPPVSNPQFLPKYKPK